MAQGEGEARGPPPIRRDDYSTVSAGFNHNSKPYFFGLM
jgi:hypothetical protein